MENALNTQRGNPADSMEPKYDYIFGFGSIINTETHAPWLALQQEENGKESYVLPGQRAKILAKFGYRRGWTFRSNTGFTALGIFPTQEKATDVNGVLFRITHEMLAGFDVREVGYDRVEVPRDCIELFPRLAQENPVDASYTNKSECELNIQPNETMWIYVPRQCFQANEDHPILQSYVDTVLQGCLEWGGEHMAKEFVETTTQWSPYFLNDTPSSRRPWLYRKEYSTIDRILSQNPATHFADRRHPEEFASTFLIKMMRGAWSIPRRSTVFTGRDAELRQIHARLTAQRTEQRVAKLEVAGMGGVGKTQLCTEYCYRYFPSYYGLVIWLRAPSAESVAAGYRQLMADTTGMDVKDKDTDEVVAEVKARLFLSKVPWLLVFDNLEDHSLLDKFVPNGGSGHVLVTTRLINTDNVDFGDQTMILGCFNPQESVELLCRAAGEHNICCSEQHVDAAHKLADHLGHLPLALGMAAAYMRRCDVDCSEYLARYVASETSGALHLGHEAVSSSLSLSLEAIKTENPIAWDALRLLGWLGPDQITKKLLRSLLSTKHTRDKEIAQAVSAREAALERSDLLSRSLPLAVGGVALLSILATASQVHAGHPKSGVRNIVLAALVSVSAVVTLTIQSKRPRAPPNQPATPTLPMKRSSSFSADVFEQTDRTWKLLKSFSILAVKEGKGSMHRLLAQALRVSQSEQEGRYNLEICLQALLQAWTFKPEQVDTWQDSTLVLEHVKAVVMHSIEQNVWSIETAILSKEAGVFSAMSLNRFEEAQFSLEQSLRILDGVDQTNPAHIQAQAAALHELGRVFRYEGKFRQAEEALSKALKIRNRLATQNLDERSGVAATLHEFGVLEVKNHNLDSAAAFLQQALDLRRTLEMESPGEEIEADCASTLHQLAAVQVALKPPSLDQAESLLKEALTLNMQIGQRAATLKQLARVAIRRGEFDIAEKSLAQALELYVELYGKSTLHINVAAVKFQQGALAFQREQFEQAWIHFSDCLRARRHVYAFSQGNHLEVSSVLHELGCVAFAQRRFPKACEMLTAEKQILDQLYDASSQRQRLLQSLLTNLTWLRKCAKERGDEAEVRKLTAERSELKRKVKQHIPDVTEQTSGHPPNLSLQREALRCRLAARKYALAAPESQEASKKELIAVLSSLRKEIESSPVCPMQEASVHFHETISDALTNPNKRSIIFEACDDLRDVLRDHGLQVQDVVQTSKR